MSSLPVFLIAGLAEAPMSAAAMGLQCDLPGAVLLRHDIDVERRTLTRTIADLTGVLEITAAREGSGSPASSSGSKASR